MSPRSSGWSRSGRPIADARDFAAVAPHNHPVLAALVDGETLHTARIVTWVTRERVVELAYATLRLGLNGGGTDNFRAGATGNAIAPIDPRDGRLGRLQLGRADGCGFERSATVPATAARAEGVLLPDWEATMELVRRASLAVLPARTPGWDVAVGPVVAQMARVA